MRKIKAFGIGFLLVVTLLMGSLTALATTGSYIGFEKARALAFADAKVEAKDVTVEKEQLKRSGQRYYYDLEFFTATAEYEYELDATTGAISEREKKTRKSTTGAQLNQSGYIGVEKAKTIALTDAKVATKDATFMKEQLTRDDGRYYYDVEFYTNTMRYEYEIAATTGTITEKSSKQSTSIGLDTTASTTPKTTTPSNKQFIGAEAAKAAALAHAGSRGTSAKHVTVEFDTDDDVYPHTYSYEVEFLSGGHEYKYKIDAVTGVVIGYEID